MDTDFSPETSRLRAKDSDGKEYLVGSLEVQEQVSEVGQISVYLAAKKTNRIIGNLAKIDTSGDQGFWGVLRTFLEGLSFV